MPLTATNLSRRRMLAGIAVAGLGSATCTPAFARSISMEKAKRDRLDAALRQIMDEHRLPGLSVGLIENGRETWSSAYGYADLDAGRPMTVHTIQNFGSVTKIVTATAVLQLFERGQLSLDSDINNYIPFTVRNPRFPDTPITARQLLAHRSSILDADAYGDSYRCGDQKQSLRTFLETYFASDHATHAFHAWKPGTQNPPRSPRPYSNVAFGLLGLLVESVSGLDFEEYCRDRIFRPLGMADTGFALANINTANHARPYAVLSEDFDPARIRGKYLELSEFTPDQREVVPGQPWPFCLYTFATPSDGMMRTSVSDIGKFVAAWANMGLHRESGFRILRPGTVELALTPRHFGQMLAWSEREAGFGDEAKLPGGSIVYHNGGDPGIGTLIAIRPGSAQGIMVAFNRGYDDAYLNPVATTLLQALEDIA